ncbi:MAG: ATP-binding SpoIIE family protein phosphatase [Candidatus Limnocylindria bacterium]
MSMMTGRVRGILRRRKDEPAIVPPAGERQRVQDSPPVEIAPSDPILGYFQQASGPVALDDLQLDSPAVRDLRAAGVKLVVPLISQGELIGLLNLGPRLSEQEYSSDDRQLLEKLASQAAPAVRVAQLVREQEADVRARERIDQELRVAQLIQQQFLPKQLPRLQGWHVAAFYRAAQEVGGDFYDFFDLPDGKIGIVVGDVTGHGVPAALVMATTRSLIRSDAPRLASPSGVLERANDFLGADIPANMFVTCLYAILDPASGTLRFANAGHDLPYVRRSDGSVIELRATGMPLGAMPGMRYDEKQATLGPGDVLLLHSDGVAEAHGPGREMFGFPRMRELMAGHTGGQELIDGLLEALHRFTGEAWEQEDDITLVTLSRGADVRAGDVLAEFEMPSEPGNERAVMERVAEAVRPLGIVTKTLERLKTAVSETAMNAIEHGNELQRDLPVSVRVETRDGRLTIAISDQGGTKEIPEAETPDIEAKLAGLQRPRGWGLFLIKNMVDQMNVSSDGAMHTVELVFDLAKATKGGSDAGGAGR